jgi:hypothetical protein
MTGATGPTGAFSTTGTLFYASYGTGATGSTVPVRLSDMVSFATNTPNTVKISVATGATGVVITIDV